MVIFYMVKYRRATYAAMFVGMLLLVPAVAQEKTDQSITEQLLDEVRQLRAEVSAIRNENEILRHRLESLLKQLDMEVEGASSFPSATKPLKPTVVARESAPRTPDKRVPADISPEETVAEEAQETDEPIKAEKPVVLAPSSGRREFPLIKRSALLGSAKERAAYLDALAHLDRNDTEGDYERLRYALKQFLKAHPGSVYEPKAHYWIAESYYTEKQYHRAVQSFTQYIRQFPDGGHVENAQLKIADIYREQGDMSSAKDLLMQLVDSDNERIQRLARRKLEMINKDARR